MDARAVSSPAIGEWEGRKKRKVRTCVNCRKRKLQCDQSVPSCGRCTKGGQECSYVDDPPEVLLSHAQQPATTSATTETEIEYGRVLTVQPAHSSSSPLLLTSLLARLDSQERRLNDMQLELASLNRLSGRQQVLIPTIASTGRADYDTQRESAYDIENRIFKGKGFKTRYFGPSYPESLITNIPAFAKLAKEIVLGSPILVKVRQDLREIEARDDAAKCTRLPVSKQDLEALLPTQSDASELVRLYFELLDPIYHIIHIPSFNQEYDGLWSNPSQSRPAFLALVLAITSSTRLLRREAPGIYVGKNSVARDNALRAIHTCEEWLAHQKQKQATINDFQIRFLINLAKALVGTQWKRAWTESVGLLKHSMATGLNVNPDVMVSTSLLDREMRKRIWHAVREFELHAALARGMPSDPLAVESETPAPNNILDEDLGPESQSLPTPKAMIEFTRISYLAFACTTYKLRHKLTRVLNSRQMLSSDECRSITEEIEGFIRNIPQWPGHESANLPRVLLHLNLRQYLLVLHNRQLRHTTSASEREFSRMVLMNTSVEILNAHMALLAKDCHVAQLLSDDDLRLPLTVCHVISQTQTQFSVVNDAINVHAERVVADVVDLLAGKIDRLGAGKQRLWTALVAKAFVKIYRNPEQKPMYMHEAVNRMTALYYKIMACQTIGSNVAIEQPGTPHPLSTNNSNTRGIVNTNNPHSLQQRPGTGEGDASNIDLHSISAWMFDEWTYNAEFQGFDNNPR